VTDFDKIAHLIRFGLTFKKMTVQSITDWADKKIDQEPDNSIFFDLVRAHTTNNIIDCFSKTVTWDFNKADIKTLILSYYKEYLDKNRRKWFDIEEELIGFFNYFEYENSSAKSNDFLYYLEEDLALRNAGYSGLVTMPDYLESNLKHFNDYNKLIDLLVGQGLIAYLV
jgi:hypothetical protein